MEMWVKAIAKACTAYKGSTWFQIRTPGHDFTERAYMDISYVPALLENLSQSYNLVHSP
jgi:hypothetical protein